MEQTLLQQRIAALLQRHHQDKGAAAAALQQEAMQDMPLLLALTKPFLAGAAAHAVQKYTPSKNNTPRAPSKVVAPTLSHRTSPNTMGESLWEALVTQLEHNNNTPPTGADLEQHEKALRTVAKAFMAKRLDSMAETRPLPPR